jgi:hypothetical protein
MAGSASKSGSESISQRHGSADPHPDPNQNFMAPKTLLLIVSPGRDKQAEAAVCEPGRHHAVQPPTEPAPRPAQGG